MPSNEKICVDPALAIQVGAAIGARVVSKLPAAFWEDGVMVQSLLNGPASHWDQLITPMFSAHERKRLLAGEEGDTSG